MSKSRTAEARAVAVTVVAATGAMMTGAVVTTEAMTVVMTEAMTEAMTVVMTVTVVATDPDPGVVDVMTAAGSHLVDLGVEADRPAIHEENCLMHCCILAPMGLGTDHKFSASKKRLTGHGHAVGSRPPMWLVCLYLHPESLCHKDI